MDRNVCYLKSEHWVYYTVIHPSKELLTHVFCKSTVREKLKEEVMIRKIWIDFQLQTKLLQRQSRRSGSLPL